MLIYGERVYLGQLTEEDAPSVFQWLNEHEFRRLVSMRMSFTNRPGND